MVFIYKKVMTLTKYRIHFEPVDIEANDPDDAIRLLDEGVCPMPDVRSIYPIDKNGFPLQDKV